MNARVCRRRSLFLHHVHDSICYSIIFTVVSRYFYRMLGREKSFPSSIEQSVFSTDAKGDEETKDFAELIRINSCYIDMIDRNSMYRGILARVVGSKTSIRDETIWIGRPWLIIRALVLLARQTFCSRLQFYWFVNELCATIASVSVVHARPTTRKLRKHSFFVAPILLVSAKLTRALEFPEFLAEVFFSSSFRKQNTHTCTRPRLRHEKLAFLSDRERR